VASCSVDSTIRTVKTYKVKPVIFEDGALVILNYENVTSYRRYESKGLLCKEDIQTFYFKIIDLQSCC
jgi:hypothetical protein